MLKEILGLHGKSTFRIKEQIKPLTVSNAIKICADSKLPHFQPFYIIHT